MTDLIAFMVVCNKYNCAGFGLDDGYCYGHGDGRDGKSNRYGDRSGYDGTGFGKNGKGLDMMDGDGHLRGSDGEGLGGRSRGAGGYGDRLRSGGGGEGADGLGRDNYGLVSINKLQSK